MNDLAQQFQHRDEAHSEPQPQNDTAQIALERKLVEDLWSAAIKSATPVYRKRLTRKQLTTLIEAKTAIGPELFQRVVQSVVRRWDQWVMEDDKGQLCTADPDCPPVHYLVRYISCASFELRDHADISDDTLEALMDWMNAGPKDGIPYPL